MNMKKISSSIQNLASDSEIKVYHLEKNNYFSSKNVVGKKPIIALSFMSKRVNN